MNDLVGRDPVVRTFTAGSGMLGHFLAYSGAFQGGLTVAAAGGVVPAVGIVMPVCVGEAVKAGDALAEIRYRDEAKCVSERRGCMASGGVYPRRDSRRFKNHGGDKPRRSLHR